MKNSFPTLSEKLFAHSPSEIAISSITIFELEYGAAKSQWGERTRQNMRLFLAPFTYLSFDMDDAIAAGNIRGLLSKNGIPIGPYDVQLAGQAIAKDLTMVTHNTGEFSRVPNLKIEDWTL